MRRFYLLIIALAFLLPFGNLKAGGGPDAYGYVWLASTDAGGPSYGWIDITSTGTLVTGLADDNSVGTFPIGFNFHYYWSDFNAIKVGSNGWISFDNVSNIAHCFPTIPSAGGIADNYLAPFMADLNFNGGSNPGDVYYWSNNVDTFIISYLNAPFWVNATPDYTGSNTFQVILTSTDSSITFQYNDMEPTFTNNTGCASDNVVGIENSTGAIGLGVFQEVMPPDNFVIKFYYPDSVLINVPDLSANWNQNTKSAGVFYQTGLVPLQANVRNSGNVDITSSSSITANIQNAALATQWTGSATLPSIVLGDDSTFVFASPPTLNTAGYYYFNNSISNSSDINPGNNSLQSEVVVVDLSGPTSTLSYATGGNGVGTLSWSGGAGDDGGGVYMEPPVYPIDISSLEYYLTTSGLGDSIIIGVYDDNGPAGSPGTVLWSDTIQASGITSGQWNQFTIPTPVTITSGGFYIGYFQGGGSVFLGTEATGPLSRRNYEILSGAWAEWRSNQTDELLIKANISGYDCTPTAGFTSAASANVATFTNATSGGTTYVWDFGDGNSSTSANPTHTYSAAGTYTVCMIATNICGSDTICNPITVTCPIPGPAFTYTATGITLNFTNGTTSGTSYLWDFGDGNTSTSANPTHTYAAPGSYTVCLTATNVCGTDSTCQTVQACFLPTANFLSTVSGSSVQFTNISSSATSLIWDFGDGFTSSMVNPSHTYGAGGTYTVCLIASNACGVDTFCQNVTVSCTSPSSGFTFSASNTTVNFTDASTAGTGSIQLYSWDFGDGNNSSSQNPSHTYATSGNYTVCLTVTDSCGTDSSCQVVNICADPVPQFNFTAVQGQVTFNETSSITGSATYSWDFGDGNFSTIPNPIHTYTNSGMYTVCLTITDACGTDSSCQTVNVVIISVEPGQSGSFTVWPNPAESAVQVQVTGPMNGAAFTLTDLAGKALWHMDGSELQSGGTFRIETADLPRGVYFLRMAGESGQMTKKIVLR